MKGGRAWPLAALLIATALVLTVSPVASAQSCAIQLSVQPARVPFPFGTIPPPGATTFSETFDVSYPSSIANQTVTVQYLNGSRWYDLESFAANTLGFTETGYGLDSGWVRFGTTSVRAADGSCTSNTAAFEVRYDPGAVLADVGAYGAIMAFAAAFLYLGRSLGWKRFVIVAIPVYLAIAPWTGQRYDVYFLLSSGIRILQHVNPFTPGNPPTYPGSLKWAYPPLYALYSALCFLVYQVLTGASLPAVSSLTWPGWLTSTYNVYRAFVPPNLPVLVTLLKLPMVASAVLTGFLLTKMTGKESAAVWWLANPLVVLVAAVWGELDPIATLLAVASLYYFQKGKGYHAYLLASFGAAVKVWPALVIPIMLVVSLRRDGVKALRPVIAVVPAVLATVGLYGAYGNLLNSLFVFVYARGVPTFAGAFSVNGLTWQEILFVLKSPPVPLFLYVGIPAYILVLISIYVKRDADIVKWTVVSILLLFVTYNYVNPQYFYWLVPLLILQRRKLAAAAFTLLPLFFVLLAYDAFYFVSPAILPNMYLYGASVLEQLKVNALYHSAPVFVLVAGVFPTVAYSVLLYSELTKRVNPPRSTPSADPSPT